MKFSLIVAKKLPVFVEDDFQAVGQFQLDFVPAARNLVQATLRVVLVEEVETNVWAFSGNSSNVMMRWLASARRLAPQINKVNNIANAFFISDGFSAAKFRTVSEIKLKWKTFPVILS